MPRPKKTRRPLSEESRARMREAALRNLEKARTAVRGGELPPSDPAPGSVPPEDQRAPAREAVTSSGPRGISAQVRRDAKTVLAFGVAGADGAAAFISQQWAIRAEGREGFWTQEDRLSKDETVQLVEAVYGELEQYPKLVRGIAEMAQTGKHAYLGYTVTMIALPRLIRHGIFKQDDPIVSALLFAGLAFEQQIGASAAVPVGAEPAPVDYRGNGHGQVDVGGSVVAASSVGSGFSEQA